MTSTSFLDVIAADDSTHRLASRKAVVVAQQRVATQFGEFIDKYGQQALDYAADDIRGVVTAAAEEFGASDPDAIYDTIVASYAPKAEPKVASTHESRKTKMCPFHKDVVDISLAQGEAKAGFDAMSQHWGGPKHCDGDGYEGDKCNFKPTMTTQAYWDQKAERAEERKQQRAEQAEELEAQQPTEDLPVDNIAPEGDSPDVATDSEPVDVSENNVIEVDFGGGAAEASEPLAVAAKVAAEYPDHEDEVPCSACHGSGKVNGERCTKCDGDGYQYTGTRDSKVATETTGLGGPVSPTIDKRVWRPKEIDTEGDGSPNPTKRKDVVEAIKADNNDNLNEIGEGTTERQDVSKDTNPSGDGASTDTWTEGPKTAVSGFISPEEIQSVLAHRDR